MILLIHPSLVLWDYFEYVIPLLESRYHLIVPAVPGYDEEEKIKVERVKGRLIFIGAEDDVLWDTCKYIRRMEERLADTPHECEYEAWLYEHGTHFMFPESLTKMILPVGFGLLVKFMFKAAKNYPKECRAARVDLDRRMRKVFKEW